MNNMHKTITLGEEKIEIECNREIVAETMTKFNTYFADILDMVEKRRAENKDDESSPNFIHLISQALRDGNADIYLKTEIYNKAITEYSLPLLIKCASDELTNSQAKSEAERIIKICEEANGLNVLCEKVFELILEGFIVGETEQKPTITIEIA